MAALVERATSELLTGPDWGMNLEICDQINHNPSLSRDMMKALRKRLTNKNAKVQLLALMVLEMIMKNCGDPMHQMVAKDVLHDMVKIVKKKGDLAVRNKVLALLESWQKAFGGPLAKYSQYSAVYDDLRRSGVQFPVQGDADTVSMFTPPAAANFTTVPAPPYTSAPANTTTSQTELAYGLPEFPPARLDDVLASSTEHSVWSTKDLDGARRTLEVLSEMLNALDPGDKQAIHDDVITHLVEQCMTNQKIVRQLVNSTSDENMLCQGLALNDDIQQVITKHSALVSNALTAAELVPGSLSAGPPPQGLAVYDNEDDEAEDELLHLAHRSRPSRPQENGLRKNMPYAQPAPYTQPASMPVVPTIGGHDQGNVAMQGSSLTASSSGLATPITPSWSHQLSDEQESMLNPFASMAPTAASSANGSSSSASHHPSHKEKTYVPDNVWSSDLPFKKQDNSSRASEKEQPPYSSSIVFDDDMVNPTASWSTAAVKQPVSGLPPPPSKYTERARFFEEKRQGSPSLTPSSSMDGGRMQSLSLNMDEMVYANGVAHAGSRSSNKPVPAPANKQADRLFEDLVDLKSMRTNHRAPGVASNLPRSKESGGANGM